MIPVALKADGSLKATSKTASTYEFGLMSHYVRKKIEHVGKEIFAGNVAVKPYLLGDRSGCDYCPYHTICGFDVRMPGFSYQQFENLTAVRRSLHISGKRLESREKIRTVNKCDVTGAKIKSQKRSKTWE